MCCLEVVRQSVRLFPIMTSEGGGGRCEPRYQRLSFIGEHTECLDSLSLSSVLREQSLSILDIDIQPRGYYLDKVDPTCPRTISDSMKSYVGVGLYVLCILIYRMLMYS